MAVKCSVFIAISLDGFISRPNGDIDWLEKANATSPPGEDYGYHSFFATVDSIVMGRNTFEKALSFGFWPYEGKKVVVLTSRSITLPISLQGKVRTMNGDPKTIVNLLSEERSNHIYIDGGLTIQKFLQKGLIDSMTTTVIPVLLGQGKPLFGPLQEDLWLHLKTVRGYENGFVQMHYTR